MKLAIFAVRDVKTSQYGNPMFLQADGQAIRSFQDECNRADAQNMLYLHPEDFELFKVGWFDTDSGLFETFVPVSVAHAASLKLKSN